MEKNDIYNLIDHIRKEDPEFTEDYAVLLSFILSDIEHENTGIDFSKICELIEEGYKNSVKRSYIDTVNFLTSQLSIK